MSGAASGPGPAPGMPGHTAAITPKTWTEGTAECSGNFSSCTVLWLNSVDTVRGKGAKGGKKGK